MKTYWIRVFAHEDMPETVCGFDYCQFKEVVAALKKRGLDFTTWTE